MDSFPVIAYVSFLIFFILDDNSHKLHGVSKASESLIKIYSPFTTGQEIQVIFISQATQAIDVLSYVEKAGNIHSLWLSYSHVRHPLTIFFYVPLGTNSEVGKRSVVSLKVSGMWVRLLVEKEPYWERMF